MSASMLGCCCCVNGIFKGILISRVKGNVKWLFLNDKQADFLFVKACFQCRGTALLNMWHSRTDD